MPAQLHQFYINQPISQLKQSVIARLAHNDLVQLDHLLDLVVLKTVTHVVDTSVRPQALSLFRADPARLVSWLDQAYPLSRVTIIEALTRVLLSLTVD